jgi:hypothetical protein
MAAVNALVLYDVLSGPLPGPVYMMSILERC